MGLLRVAGWKARQRSRQIVDTLGGFTRLEARGRRWASRWRASLGDTDNVAAAMGQWVAREQGGEFWLPRAAAADWARDTWTPADKRIADGVAWGVIDLLGSGPVKVGATPAWRRDLYTGREWPLRNAFRLSGARSRGDGSDIRTVWEMSRGAYFLPLGRTFWHSGDVRYRDTFVRHIASWPDANPVGKGPNWSSPMESAIRAANWVLALLVFAPADGLSLEFWEGMLANLFTTGLFLERHPAAQPAKRGSAPELIANAVGLVYLGALFLDSLEGQRWLRRGARMLAAEMPRQVHADGTSVEASLGLHRLVTELFGYGRDLVRRNLPNALSTDYDRRLARMHEFIGAYLPASGEAPMLGDADDSRLHAVSAEGWLSPRLHALGLPLPAPTVATPAAFTDGGFYVLRAGRDHLITRCGAVGSGGVGRHDHNDHLSFELVLGGRRVVSDSGTYAYTRDLEQRFAFRGTAAHSVIQVDRAEQNPIVRERPWRVLADRTRSRSLRWEIAPDRLLFEGQHHGFAHRPSGLVCRRRFTAQVGSARRSWQITDELIGTGAEPVTWRLHLAPTAVSHLAGGATRQELELAGDPIVRLTLAHPAGFALEVGESLASDRYGVCYPRPCLMLRGEAELPARFDMIFIVQD
ncbi:MAG TPA: alginate lyase family protein [Gemmatimonadales bacterium]|nr:alginate lyase family protein [Gemmatimonadales bacterium]